MDRIPTIKSRKPMFFIILCTIVFSFLCFPVYSADTHHQDSARRFVEQCLADPNVFIANPPADRSPYKNMTREQIQPLIDKSMSEGSVLVLYPNGLPAIFESRSKDTGQKIQRAWHMNGRLRSDELFADEQIVSGTYYNMNGITISQVEQGTGKRIVFNDSIHENSRIVGIIEYLDGLKHGTELRYRDYEKALKSQENHYEYGKRHGKSKGWNSSGRINREENHQKGRQHGRTVSWYPNGNTHSISEYVHGKMQTWTRFYENGRKDQEHSHLRDKKWYPSGQLMSDVQYHQPSDESSARIVKEAVSYDLLGHQTGRVLNQVGYLVESGRGLTVYTKHTFPRSTGLGRLTCLGGYSGRTLDRELRLTAPRDADMKDVRAEILLPDGCTSDDTLVFSEELIKSGYSAKLGPFQIQFPLPYNEWEGQILLDVQVMIKGYPVRYQNQIISKKVSDESKEQEPSKTQEIRKTAPSRAKRISYLGKHGSSDWQGTPPTFQDKQLPSQKQAVGFCISENKRWILFEDPAVLLMSEDSGESWQPLRSDFTYRPKALLSLFNENLLIWGTHRTQNPEQGIPYSVEISTDEGLTWSEFEIPRLNYLRSIRCEEYALIVSGICLPSDGIPSEKDWFELKPKYFASTKNHEFMDLAGGGGFLDIKQFLFASDSPSGDYRAYVIDKSWLGPTFAIYIRKSYDDIPVHALFVSTQPKLIWSENSKVLALKSERKNLFFAYIDIETLVSTECKFNPEKEKSARGTDQLRDFDTEVQLVLEQNRK